MQARTGRPLTITASRATGDLPDGNNQAQRADRVTSVPVYPANQTPEVWFNPAAFALPASGTWGNVGTQHGPRARAVPGRSGAAEALRDQRPAQYRVPVGGVQRLQSREPRRAGYRGHLADIVRPHHRTAQPRVRHGYRTADAVHAQTEFLSQRSSLSCQLSAVPIGWGLAAGRLRNASCHHEHALA